MFQQYGLSVIVLGVVVSCFMGAKYVGGLLVVFLWELVGRSRCSSMVGGGRCSISVDLVTSICQ